MTATGTGTAGAPVRPMPVVAVVALGGGLGASARYAAGLWWPTGAAGFPWTTFWVNVVGCALMGVLMVLVTEAFTVHRLVRPFLGTGVLGGFTTFSTYAVDLRGLFATGHSGTAAAYLAATPLAALTAVWLAATATRRILAPPPEPGPDATTGPTHPTDPAPPAGPTPTADPTRPTGPTPTADPTHLTDRTKATDPAEADIPDTKGEKST